MQYLIYIYYPLLVILILWGGKYFKKGTWNEDFLSLSQTKSLQGFCSLCMILHHIGQKTCAPWLDSEAITHGLDCFVPIGYLLVAVFFFCSGFGLSKSYREKQDYLNGFLGRRCLIPLLMVLITDFVMLAIRSHMKETISVSGPFRLNGPLLLNGYAWFVYTLLLFYLLFYFAYKYSKSEKSAGFFVFIGVLLYIFFCDWWMYGTWWYNSALLFAMGIIWGEYESALLRNMRKYYGLLLPITLLATGILFSLGEYTQSPLVQIPASCTFVLSLLLLTMKIKIGNKVLTILGSITLEVYLLHGIFLQIFGFNESVFNPYQIKNVPLLVLIVLLCTLIASFPVHKLIHSVAAYILKHKEMTTILWKDFKKFLKVSFIVFIVITLFSVMKHHQTRSDAQELLENFKNENITFANVDGKKMAARIVGEGKHTAVLLRGLNDPCPTLTLSALANTLAIQNKVIILDYFGCDFSDSTDRKRTAENFVYEIRTALQDLGMQGPYIFVAHEISGLYAQLYAQYYPEEVEAIVGLDSAVAAQPQDLMRETNTTPTAYQEQLKKQSILNLALRKSFYITGYGRMVWPIYQKGIKAKLSAEEYTILEEQFIDNYYSADSMEEMALKYDNHQLLLHHKFREDLPLLFVLSDYAEDSPLYPGSDWVRLHEDLCTNPAIQSILYINANPYLVYYAPDYTAETIQKFIDSLDTRE